jgi:hypothetical protein
MITENMINVVVAPFGLICKEGRLHNIDGRDGSVAIDSIYEMMFLHNVTRKTALTQIAGLLEAVVTPTKTKKKDDSTT